MDDINNPHYKLVKSAFEFKVRDNAGEVVLLRKYEGFVCMFVNIASKSGFAENMYKLLNQTYDAFEVKGLRILAFPCNQFNGEEPGSRDKIRKHFKEVGARFHLFDKINVNGEKAHQLYKYLKEKLPDEKTKLGVIKDNFTIFVVNKVGYPFLRLEPPPQRDKLYGELSAYLGDPVISEEEASKPWKKRPGSKSNTQSKTTEDSKEN